MTTGHFGILVAIETDATRYHGEHPQLPIILDRGSAEQMLSHLAADLESLFPGLQRFSLAMPGALYDMSQVLRPEFPILQSLETFAKDAATKSMGQLLSIGAVDGRMPAEPLQPETAIPPGALQLLPITVGGEVESLVALEDEMEHRFMEEGQVSAHTAKALEASFNISVAHARLMTMTDLQAMLKLQLEHFGFLALWELLDCAINGETETRQLVSANGHQFTWTGNAVQAAFETFDFWATRGSGAETQQDLGEAYAQWTREYRQYLVTLAHHHVPLSQVIPGGDEALGGSFFIESVGAPAQEDCASVTEHFHPELGTIAVTVIKGDEQLNLYPLSPEGLNDLHAHIRDSGLAGDIAFPGEISIDSSNRSLKPECIDAEA